MLQLFKDETTGTLSHDESVAAGAERTTGLLWLFVAGGESVHGVEAADTCGADSCLSTTSYDSVGLAQTNQIEGISQCI